MGKQLPVILLLSSATCLLSGLYVEFTSSANLVPFKVELFGMGVGLWLLGKWFVEREQMKQE